MNKTIQTRNPRLSANEKELKYLYELVEKDLTKSQKFDKDSMLFKLTILKKLEQAKWRIKNNYLF